MLSTAATTNTGPSPFGPFALLAKLARGDLADSFLARRRGAGGFEKLVVIKRIHPQLTQDPELVELFLGEARVAAHIDHPNVRRVYELGEVERHFYIAVEYLEGVPLMELLLARKREPKLADHRVLTALVAQACEGLYAAHAHADSRQRPVVHGDLNPRSLFVTSSGYAKILDFEIVEMRGALAERHGFVQRTCAYMAPEQVRGGVIDARSDIFSLGVVAWEAVTGRRLFKQKTRERTIAAIDQGVIPRPSKFNPAVSPLLDDAILRALERDPALRYATAREFGTALDKASLAEGPPLTPLAAEALVLEAFGPELDAQRHFVRRARTDRDTPLPGQAQGDADIDTEAETRISDPPFVPIDDELGTLPGLDDDDAAPEPLAWQESASFVLSAVALDLGDADDGDGAGVVTVEDAGGARALGGFDDDESGVILTGAAVVRPAAAPAGVAPPVPPRARRRRPIPITSVIVAAAIGFAAVALYGLLSGDGDGDAAGEQAATGGGEPAAEPAAVLAGDADEEAAASASEREEERRRAAAQERRQERRRAAERERQQRRERAAERERREARERADEQERRQEGRRAAERERADEKRRAAQQRRQERKRAAERERQAKLERAAEREREAELERAQAEPGFLTLDSQPYATVYIDGEKQGFTPLVKARLAAGVHRIKLVSSEGGAIKTLRVDIEPGKTARRKVTW